MARVLATELEPLWERWRAAGYGVPPDALLQVERVLRVLPEGISRAQSGDLITEIKNLRSIPVFSPHMEWADPMWPVVFVTVALKPRS